MPPPQERKNRWSKRGKEDLVLVNPEAKKMLTELFLAFAKIPLDGAETVLDIHSGGVFERHDLQGNPLAYQLSVSCPFDTPNGEPAMLVMVSSCNGQLSELYATIANWESGVPQIQGANSYPLRPPNARNHLLGPREMTEIAIEICKDPRPNFSPKRVN